MLETALHVVLILTSIFLIGTVLLHKGQGGGLSDMFGGGFTAQASSSGVMERNLNRLTIITAVTWTITIILIGILGRP